jgi:menaquinone-dependent protoporphyrinogen IX oxidase
MVKVFVVYDTKYGGTKLVAEKIVEGMREVEGIETAIFDGKEVSLEEVADSDAVLIGSPNHIGRPARGIEEFIDIFGKLDLKTKWVAVFDTHMIDQSTTHMWHALLKVLASCSKIGRLGSASRSRKFL